MQKNVLLVESDPLLASALTGALEARGFTVSRSTDGQEGFDLARALHPDCIVLCAELPGRSGYTWCNKLKKEEDLRAIPLVITSSESTPETFEHHRKLKTRAEDYLQKPFAADTLVDRVGALIGFPEPLPAVEILTLDDVDLEELPPESPVTEEDEELRALDAAFDSIHRSADSAGTAPRAEAPITVLPEKVEQGPGAPLDLEMEAALADLAAEAASEPRAEPDARASPGAFAEIAGLRAEVASLRETAERARAEGASQREAAERARAEAAALRDEVAVLSRRIAELESGSPGGDDRVAAVEARIRAHERLREKTRRALSIVLDILDEKPGSGGGSAPPTPER